MLSEPRADYGDFIADFLSTSKKHTKAIQKIFKPLQDVLNVRDFFYCTIQSNGTYASIRTRLDAGECMIDNQFYRWDPFLCHPNFLKSGIVLWGQIANAYDQTSYHEFQNDLNLDHTFMILERDVNKSSFFGFSGPASEPHLLSNYLNELPLFRRYIDYFLAESRPIIDSMESERLDLFPVLNGRFTQSSFETSFGISDPQRLRFIREISKNPLIDIHLTSREKECLKYLLKGYTAKQTADEINLSIRTIENYLMGIKQKLHCRDKSTLFKMTKDLEMLGIL